MADRSDQPDDIERGGGEDEADAIDPELVALAEERTRGSALRPILFLAVIGLGCWMIADFWHDISYVFSSRTPTEVGDVTNAATEGDEPPDWEEVLPHNELVSLSGIPKRRSQSREFRFFKLVGAPIYVQAPREESADTLAERVGDKPEGGPDRTYFDGTGRLIKLWKVPERYTGFKQYYRQKYGTRFCEYVDDEERERILRKRRTAVVENWRERYEEASEEERAEEGLTPEPTDQEVEEIVSASPVCVYAFLFKAEETPWSNWEYLLLAALFGVFILLNIYWLIRWFRVFFGSSVDVRDLVEE